MKRTVIYIIIIIAGVCLVSARPGKKMDVAGEESEKERKIDSLMIALYSRGQFTGSILVADHGKPIYKRAFGMADRQTEYYSRLIQKNISALFQNSLRLWES